MPPYPSRRRTDCGWLTACVGRCGQFLYLATTFCAFFRSVATNGNLEYRRKELHQALNYMKYTEVMSVHRYS